MPARRPHLDQLGLALRHLLHDDAGVLLVDVDHDLFDRLFQFAGLVAAQQNLRPRHRQLEAFAPHRLDQDAELQLAAAGDLHRVTSRSDSRTRSATLPSASRSRRSRITRLVTLSPSVPAKRRIVHAERHRERRRIDRLRRHRRLDLGRADRVRHGGVRQPGDGDDVAGLRLVDRHALEPAECQHLGDAAALDQFAVVVEHLDLLVRLDAAGRDAAGDDAAEIGIGLEDGAEQAERAFFDDRRSHVLEHQLEQRRHAVVVRAVEASPTSSPAWPSRRGSGNRAARRSRRARRTGRTPR